MKILSNKEYTQLLTETANRAWVDGFNYARKNLSVGWEREFERG